jgi:flagellar biosynthesis/type III secretory pathway protein FliH
LSSLDVGYVISDEKLKAKVWKVTAKVILRRFTKESSIVDDEINIALATLDETKTGKSIVLEISPKYFSTWDYSKY